MAVQIFQEPGFGERLGTALGTGLGSGLSQGVQSMLQQKMQQLGQRQQAQSLIPGLQQYFPQASPEELQSIAMQSPAVISQMIKEQSRQSSDQAYAELANQILGGTPKQLPENQPAPLDAPGLLGQQSPNLGRISGKQMNDLIKIQQRERQNQLQQEIASEKANKIFLNDFRKQYDVDRKIFKEAESALKILKKYKDTVPQGYTGLLPDKFFTDPHTRELLTRYNAITNLLGQSNKGQPTQFKLQLIQAGKVDKSQPIETQIANLEHLLADISSTTLHREKLIEDLKDKNKGAYPTNLGSSVIARESAIDDLINELPDPTEYSDDTVLEIDGIEFAKKYNQWMPKGAARG